MDNLSKEKKERIKIAKQLLYSRETIEKIEHAKSLYEIDRIMIQARQNKK